MEVLDVAYPARLRLRPGRRLRADHAAARALRDRRAVNREQRLRRELPEELKDRAAELAQLPVAQVDLIVGAIRLSRREGRTAEQQRRRQARQDARKHGHHREAIPGRNLRLVAKQAEGAAGGDLFFLGGLADIRRSTDDLIAHAVAGCRAQGLSDTLIGDALGVTRAAVGQRFGRKGSFTADAPDAGDPA